LSALEFFNINGFGGTCIMKRRNIGLWIMIGFLFNLTAYGCDTAKKVFNIGYENKNVEYSINGDQISHNANDDSYFSDRWGESKTLTWYCGNYKEQTRKEVRLRFKKNGGIWVLNSEDISDGHNCR